MTQTLYVDARRPLTAQEIERVQAYVDLLTADPEAPRQVRPPNRIDWAAINALFADKPFGGDKTSVELVHEAMEAWADKLERESR